MMGSKRIMYVEVEELARLKKAGGLGGGGGGGGAAPLVFPSQRHTHFMKRMYSLSLVEVDRPTIIPNPYNNSQVQVLEGEL